MTLHVKCRLYVLLRRKTHLRTQKSLFTYRCTVLAAFVNRVRAYYIINKKIFRLFSLLEKNTAD